MTIIIGGLDPIEQSYVVKRMNQSNGAVYYQPKNSSNSAGQSSYGKTDSMISNPESSMNGHRNSVPNNNGGSSLSGTSGILGQLSKSTILSIFVIVLLIFLFCSSLYLVFRIDSLQRQVFFRYISHFLKS